MRGGNAAARACRQVTSRRSLDSRLTFDQDSRPLEARLRWPMRILVDILLTVAMLAHAALGCLPMHCGGHCSSAAGPQSTCRHDCRDHAAPEDRSAPRTPHHGCPCVCRAECRFLPVYRLKLEKPQRVARELSAPRDYAPGCEALAKAEYDRCFDSHSAAPPVRLHLALQILLI